MSIYYRPANSKEGRRTRVLIVDGFSNHNWLQATLLTLSGKEVTWPVANNFPDDKNVQLQPNDC